jgi:hypothetical protein
MTAPLSDRKPPSDPVLSLPLIVRALEVGAPTDDSNVAVDCSRAVNVPWRGYAADAVPAAYLLIALGERAVAQAKDVLSVVEPAACAQPEPHWDRELRDGVRSVATTARVLADACDELAAHVAVTSDEEAAALPVAPAPKSAPFGLLPLGVRRTTRQKELADLLADCEETATTEDDNALALGCLWVRKLLTVDGDVTIDAATTYIMEVVRALNAQAKRYPEHPDALATSHRLFDLAVSLMECLNAMVDDAAAESREVSK